MVEFSRNQSADEIIIRLAARKFGIKLNPLSPTASAAQLDVESAFEETVLEKVPQSAQIMEKFSFNSEPE